jgi:tetratricopeptide (TPR) repeat protein
VTVSEETFSEALKRLRGTRSIRDVAALASLGKTVVSDVENGRRKPTEAVALALDAALGAQGYLVDLYRNPPGMPAIERAAALHIDLSEQLCAGPMSDAALEEWEFTIARHGRATRYRPERLLLPELIADFRDLRSILNHRHPPAARARLLSACAQMSGLMALLLLKTGDPSAHDWWRTGRQAASQASDRPTLAWIYAHESYQLFYGGDLVGAVELAVRAQQLAGGMPCVADALAAPLEARAHALMGNRGDAIAALARAETALSRLPAEQRQPSALGYDEAQLAFHAGNAWTSLHESTQAWNQQQRALALYPDENRTDRTLILLDRAACLIWDGDQDDGAKLAADCVFGLPLEHRNQLIISRAREVTASLPEGEQQRTEVRALREMLALPPGS